MADTSNITAPVAKAITALGAGAASSALSVSQQAQSFFPTNASEWMAFTASTAAVIYTLHLLSDWYWKKVWRPYFERKGWLKPTNRRRRFTDTDYDELES